MKDWKKEFRNYKRFPIQIGRSSIMLVHMYDYEYDHIEDLFVEDELQQNMCIVDFEAAANQFMNQLEGSGCIAFLQALRDRCDIDIKKWEEDCKATNEKYNLK